jgi:hypothetical protein
VAVRTAPSGSSLETIEPFLTRRQEVCDQFRIASLNRRLAEDMVGKRALDRDPRHLRYRSALHCIAHFETKDVKAFVLVLDNIAKRSPQRFKFICTLAWEQR